MTIKPYRINIPKSQLDELHERLKNTRWPIATATSEDWSRGVPLPYLKKLADYWLHTFDWRKQEAWLNQYDQFVADVDGQSIHFFHAKSTNPDAMPLMLLHGWPGSGVEYIKLIDLLQDAFRVIIPTIPGFGLSTPVKDSWDVTKTTKAYDQIMRALGYESYGVCGGDIGGGIASALDQINPNITGVLGCTDIPAIIWFSGFTGVDQSKNPHLSEAQKKEVQTLLQNRQSGDGYLAIQTTRPQTIGYLLNDSPVGQLAWMIEKYKEWTGDGQKVPEKNIDLDQTLTNISLYWFTGSGAASADFLHNNTHAEIDWGATPHAPAGMTLFGTKPIGRLLMDPEKQMPYWVEHKEGGHFPGMEVPELLAADLRAFFRDKRE